MHSKVFFYTLLLTLVLAGFWGLVHIGILTVGAPEEQRVELINSSDSDSADLKSLENVAIKSVGETSTPPQARVDFADIQTLILEGYAHQAASTINQRYSYLSRDQLSRLKQDFLNSAANANSDKKKDILMAASRVFDELDVWKSLANASVKSTNWQLAFDAQFRASELENDSIELEILISHLVKSSSYLRSEYERNSDQLSIKALYQRLVDLHPQVGIFQLELANTHARLDNYQAAERIYSNLSYDPELGDIARQALAKIRETTTAQPPIASAQQPEKNLRANDIVVPLIAAGSSFLVDASIERQRSRLLLDTGASITALSTELIQRLNLTPTGQSIQLSTANGLTHARLYRAESLRLGRLTLRNMIVAEIDLGRRGRFDGLLGTDALNQFKSQYSYVIDNQKNALIFRARQ